MNRPNAILIAAVSGRALAASARRGGYVPLVADFFGDQDTIAAAHAHVRLESGLGRGMDCSELIEAFEELAASRQPAGVVCGTGFEDRPHLLAAIARRWSLLGNSAETVERIKDPLAFAVLCHSCGIPHPETSVVAPTNTDCWLVKRRGGAGGWHVRAANGHSTIPGFYFQRRVDGLPVSALVLANGVRAVVIGLSMQWSSPTPSRPFRYGGAVRPAIVGQRIAFAITHMVQRLTAALPTRGLSSVDFLVDGQQIWLLEVNPRPGATLDLFEPADQSLLALHVAACAGFLPRQPLRYDDAMASAIVYAEREVAQMPDRDWPEWTADRPSAGTSVRAGEPLCTVISRASTPERAKEIVLVRAATIQAMTNSASP
jgi:predicted ATP-grasp superfamily ATP-dependent carboligase